MQSINNTTAWAVLVGAAMFAFAPVALAQDYPAKGRAITTIVPSTAGGGTDTAARLVAPLMAKDLGVPVQVVNKPGASMQIGARSVSVAAAQSGPMLDVRSSISSPI